MDPIGHSILPNERVAGNDGTLDQFFELVTRKRAQLSVMPDVIPFRSQIDLVLPFEPPLIYILAEKTHH